MDNINKYLAINLENGTLVFTYISRIDDNMKDKVNTATLIGGRFLYELKYFRRFKTQIAVKLNLVLKRNKIHSMTIRNIKIVNYCLDFIRFVSIDTVIFRFNTSLPKEIYEKLILLRNIKYIDCYYMPNYILRKFQNRKIKVDINYRKKISDEFMLEHDAIDYDTLYYKKNINIKKFDEDTINNFIEFLRINSHLKIISLYIFDPNEIRKLVNILNNEDIEGVIILLQQEFDREGKILQNFTEFKKINEMYKNNCDGEIRIVYSGQFIRNNLFKQLTFNNLKLISILVLYIAVVGIFFVEFYKYISELNMNRLQDALSSAIETESSNRSEGSSTTSNNNPVDKEDNKYNFSKSFPTLLKINKETVGWLTVNGTKINYPVVKGKNNEYYLKRDFYKNKATAGWVFMDYRNNKNMTDDNTIIYGHRMNNETMFGSLYKIITKSWYSNEDNLIVSYDTPTKKLKYRVFSVYKITTTSDYLYTLLNTEEVFNSFINKITKRSVHNFKVPVNFGDKILTLSTCVAGSRNQRMVLHAVLIEE